MPTTANTTPWANMNWQQFQDYMKANPTGFSMSSHAANPEEMMGVYDPYANRYVQSFQNFHAADPNKPGSSLVFGQGPNGELIQKSIEDTGKYSGFGDVAKYIGGAMLGANALGGTLGSLFPGFGGAAGGGGADLAASGALDAGGAGGGFGGFPGLEAGATGAFDAAGSTGTGLLGSGGVGGAGVAGAGAGAGAGGAAGSGAAPVMSVSDVGAGNLGLNSTSGFPGLQSGATGAFDLGGSAGGVAGAGGLITNGATGLAATGLATAGLSDTAIRALTAAAGGILGGASGASMPNSTTTTSQNQLDPRMAAMLYGADGKSGLLGSIYGQATQPRSAGAAVAGQAADNYVGLNAGNDMNAMRSAANGLMGSNLSAPRMSAASMSAPQNMQAAQMQATNAANTPGMQASQINAPSQNGTDLSSAYQQMIYGDSAANPYLTGAIQKGINQSNNAFGNYLQDATKATQGLLGDIRGGAVSAGQYGGSRQGLAEGKAIEGFTSNIGRAASQFGQNNTDAAVAAQAGAYDSGQNRALSAMSGLGAQQYGAATNNAQLAQQAAQTNYGGQLQTNLANAGYANNAAQTNAGFQQNANQTNYSGNLATNQTNSGYQQGANQSNLASQLQTNGLNSQNQIAGIGASSGLLTNATNQANANDAYNLNRLGGVSGLLSPFTGYGQTQTQSQPNYSNTAGNIAGGIATGLSLYNAFK